MALIDRKTAILAKIETTYGTDAVPTGVANALLVSNVKLSPLEGGTVARDNVQTYLGGRAQIQINTQVKLDFDVEVAGSGAAGTAPAYGPLLRACGLGETITASTKVEYKPISSSFEAMSIYVHKDGQKHALTGARGTVSVNFAAGSLAKFSFSFVGLYVAPASVADPAMTLSAWQIPVPVQKVYTPTFTLHTYACNGASLMLDLKNEVKFRGLIGSESVIISDRNTSGKAVIQAPALSTKDFFAIAKASTLGNLAFAHGTVAGNIVELASSTVQVTNPKYGAADGEVMLELDLSFVPSSAGNDEFTLTVK